MIALVIDALALMGLVMALNQDSESPPFFPAIGAAIGISLLAGIGGALAVAAIGLAGLVLAIALVAAVAGIVLWAVFNVPPGRAAIGGGIFLVYKIAISAAMAFLFTTPS